MKTHIFLGLLLASTASWAQTVSADVQRCRGLSDVAARVACYDAIVLPQGLDASQGARPATPGAATSTATPSAPPRASTAAPPSNFGLRSANPDPEAQKLQSRIVGLVENFPRGLEFRFDNGQVWQITETLAGFYQLNNPQVTISKGFLGGFQMQIEGVNGFIKVRRLK